MKPSMIIKVGAIDVEVLSVPLDGELFGDFDYLKARIRVEEDLKGPLLVDTILHELFHAFWQIGKLKDKKEEEERVVSVMATIMTQVLRDNPNLITWLQKNLQTPTS